MICRLCCCISIVVPILNFIIISVYLAIRDGLITRHSELQKVNTMCFYRAYTITDLIDQLFFPQLIFHMYVSIMKLITCLIKRVVYF